MTENEREIRNQIFEKVTAESKKRVLLLNPPWPSPILRDYFCTSMSKAGYMWHPIDLLAQTGWLGQHSFEVRWLDAVAERRSVVRCLDEVSQFDPGAVILVTSPLSAPEDEQFMERLRGRCIIASGEAPFGDPEGYLKEHPGVDAVMTDFTTDATARFLLGERKGLNGLWWREESGIRRGPDPTGPFWLPVPRHDLPRARCYHMPLLGGARFATVLTDMGCRHRCRLCNQGSRGHRLRDLGNLGEELDYLARLGFSHVLVKDMSFGGDRAHALEVCARMAGRGLTWHAYVRPDDLDDELSRAMADSGCRLVQFGIESGDEALRRSYGKRLDDEAIECAVGTCRRTGMKVGFHFVLGLQGENVGTLLATRRLMHRLRPDFVSLNIAILRRGSTAERDTGPPLLFAPGDTWVRAARTLLYLDYYLNPRFLLGIIGGARSGRDLGDRIASGFDLFKSLLLSSGREGKWISRLRSKSRR